MLSKPISAPSLRAGPVVAETPVRGRGAVVAIDLKLVGDLRSPTTVHVDGWVQGEIISPRVTVSEHGYVEGVIIADMVEIRGVVTGRIEAMEVAIAGTADVEATIFHHHISIERGARVEGRRPWRPRSGLIERRPWWPEQAAP